MSKTVRNEQTKLTATFFNNCSVAVIAGGIFVPGLLVKELDIKQFVLGAVFGTAIGVMLHMAGYFYLRKLEE